MAEGVVKWFDNKKGFGFISAEEETADIFVHYSDIVGTGYKTIEDGARVYFDIISGDQGPIAKKVSKL